MLGPSPEGTARRSQVWILSQAAVALSFFPSLDGVKTHDLIKLASKYKDLPPKGVIFLLLCLVSYKTGCTCRVFCLNTHNTAVSTNDFNFKCVHEESFLQSSLFERLANRGVLVPKQRRAFGVWLLALWYTTLFILHELWLGLSVLDLFFRLFC